MSKTFKMAVFSLVVFSGLYAGCGKKDKKAAKTQDKNAVQKTKQEEVKETQNKPESQAQKQEVEKTKRENSHEGSASFSGQSEGH